MILDQVKPTSSQSHKRITSIDCVTDKPNINAACICYGIGHWSALMQKCKSGFSLHVAHILIIFLVPISHNIALHSLKSSGKPIDLCRSSTAWQRWRTIWQSTILWRCLTESEFKRRCMMFASDRKCLKAVPAVGRYRRFTDGLLSILGCMWPCADIGRCPHSHHTSLCSPMAHEKVKTWL